MTFHDLLIDYIKKDYPEATEELLYGNMLVRVPLKHECSYLHNSFWLECDPNDGYIYGSHDMPLLSIYDPNIMEDILEYIKYVDQPE